MPPQAGAEPLDAPRAASAREVSGKRLHSIFQCFRRKEWGAFHAGATLSLTDEVLQAQAGLNEPVSTEEVADIYLPLARLLGLNISAARTLDSTIQNGFFNREPAPRPYIIGVAGSVAVGKSTFSRLLQAVLASSFEGLDVRLVATDGFLLSTGVLKQRDLMRRKGFPESYDLHGMLSFLIDLKAGVPNLRVPIYSHHLYDVLPSEFQVIDRPDVVVFEGLNVLQTLASSVVASDFFDFSVYIDADAADIESWYVERFLLLQRTAFQDPASYFHHYRDLDAGTARDTARGIWREINGPNLQRNIAPTRERASLVLRKDASHAVEEVWLRRL